MTVLQRDGVRLAYVDEGKGEPAFVFMHGWTCNRSYFKPQHDHFKAKHRVVSIAEGALPDPAVCRRRGVADRQARCRPAGRAGPLDGRRHRT